MITWLPKYRDGILSYVSVITNQKPILLFCLCDEQAIKGIVMIQWQLVQSQNNGQCNRDNLQLNFPLLVLNDLRKRFVPFQFSSWVLICISQTLATLNIKTLLAS